MNKIILHGNVGKDPDTRKVNDKTVTKFSLATNKSYTNNSGEKITETQWHNIILWGKVAETASKYVKKGTSLIIEGEISYRSYENKDGQTVYVTEIIGQHMHFTGNKPEEPKTQKAMSDVSELPQHVQDAETIQDEGLDMPF